LVVFFFFFFFFFFFSVFFSFLVVLLFGLSTLGGFKEKHLLPHHGVVFEHTQRSMNSRSDHRSVKAGHGH
jgi:hypothetical protein